MFLSQQAIANPLMGAWEIAESKWNNENVKLPEPRAVKIYSAEILCTLTMTSQSRRCLNWSRKLYVFRRQCF